MSIIFCTTLPSNFQSGLSQELDGMSLIRPNEDCFEKLFLYKKNNSNRYKTSTVALSNFSESMAKFSEGISVNNAP